MHSLGPHWISKKEKLPVKVEGCIMPYSTSHIFRLESPGHNGGDGSDGSDGGDGGWSFSLESAGLKRAVPGCAPSLHPSLAPIASIASIAAHLAGHISPGGDGPTRPTPNVLCTIATAGQPGVQLKVIRVKGDGKCMFRALALGLARNQGRILAGDIEVKEADNLRMAVAEALCRTDKRRKQFGRAVRALQQEDSLKNYCKRLASPTFWGGEPEMMVWFCAPSVLLSPSSHCLGISPFVMQVLSDMLKVPIFVYLSESEYGGKGGYSCIQKFGERYRKPSKDGKGRRPVRLLFTGNNHFDLLVKT